MAKRKAFFVWKGTSYREKFAPCIYYDDLPDMKGLDVHLKPTICAQHVIPEEHIEDGEYGEVTLSFNQLTELFPPPKVEPLPKFKLDPPAPESFIEAAE